ncbi:MAG: cysteine hydrolase [Clostridia bacterium]|nr:cysteine hydrolase [Clostridia bacterium]
MKELLAVIDMQNDFVFGALGSSDAQAILPAVEKRISAARQAGKTVVFTRDTHGEDYLSTQEGKRLPVRHCLKDSEGWQIVGGLQKSGDKVFDKPLFASVELAEYIRRENFERVEFIGVCTDICVVSNVLLTKAFSPETEVSVCAKCCAGTSAAAHEAALLTMRSCQAQIE